MLVNSLVRDRTLPLSYLDFLLHTVLNKIQYRIHRKYYPEQYFFETRYHQTVLHASLMELFGWGGDKPHQCLRIGLQSHLRALQKHMVSCQTAPGTLICNLQACCGLSFLSAQWKWYLLPSRPKVKHKPSFHRYYTPDEFSIRYLFLVLLCRYDTCAPLTKAAHYTYSLEFS